MEKQISSRYLLLQPILPVMGGMVYLGKDLPLSREVILYMIENGDTAFMQRYIGQLRDVASFSDNRFLHILDMGEGGQGVFAVLKMFDGEPLIQSLQQRPKSTSEWLACVFALGQGMQDALEAGVQGYSVQADNLWFGEDGQLKVINYWTQADPEARGAAGLCRLLVQLCSGSELLKDGSTLEEQLEPWITDLLPGRQAKLLELFRKVRLEKLSLASFVLGLQRLVDREEPPDLPEETTVSLTEYRRQDELVDAATRPLRRAVYEASPEPVRQEKQPNKLKRTMVVLSVIVVVMAGVVLWVNDIFDIKDEANGIPDPSETQANPPASVVSTAPPAAASVQQKPAVTNVDASLVVVDTPKLTGLTLAEAEKSALAAGLKYEYFLERNNNDEGVVFKQDPPAGQSVSKGDSVTFWVSKGQD